MNNFWIAGLAAIALQASALFGTAAQAGPNEFLPASACIGTTLDGEVVGSVWYQNGFAVNNHSSADRDMVCPIRYERLNPTSTSIIVRAVVNDNTNDSGGKVLAWICVSDEDFGTTCHNAQGTTDPFRGVTTLEMAFTPNSGTRFVDLRVRLPDVDGDGHKSYLAGYRVCRGSC